MANRRKKQAQRPACQRKQGKPGAKTLRGCPELYDQKKQQFNITLTPHAIAILVEIATRMGESRSQVIEKALRGEIDLQQLLDTRQQRMESTE